jgi:hypothetical protein
MEGVGLKSPSYAVGFVVSMIIPRRPVKPDALDV